MICIKADIPEEICKINDELKAIYHSKESVCIWIFKTVLERNSFMKETAGMNKNKERLTLIRFTINRLKLTLTLLFSLHQVEEEY